MYEMILYCSNNTELVNALKGFVRKLNSKFTSIQTWAGTVTAHAHLCTPMSCSVTGTANLGTPPISTLTLPRALLWNNATEEEYNNTISWINATLSYPELTTAEEEVRDLVLSDRNLASEIFGPIVERFVERIQSNENALSNAAPNADENVDNPEHHVVHHHHHDHDGHVHENEKEEHLDDYHQDDIIV